MKYPVVVSIVIPTMDRCLDVVQCVDSILKSDYKSFEIIIVDNASHDDTVVQLEKKFLHNPKVALIKSKQNLGAGGGRNLGATHAHGKYLLFVDSDNVIDSNMIDNLVSYMDQHDKCGMVGPLMLFKDDPTLIWLYFADINMYTSQAIYKGTGEKNMGQYPKVIQVGHLPNCFMMRTKDFRRIGGFDEKYLVMYEEADIAEKIKKQLKKTIYIYSKAITYHKSPLPRESLKQKDFLSKSDYRIYLLARNRVYFMKRNSTIIKFILFILLFCPMIFTYYAYHLITNRQFSKIGDYFKGSIDGLMM